MALRIRMKKSEGGTSIKIDWQGIPDLLELSEEPIRLYKKVFTFALPLFSHSGLDGKSGTDFWPREMSSSTISPSRVDGLKTVGASKHNFSRRE